MAMFRRTKGIVKKVMGVDDGMGRISWSISELDLHGVAETFRTSTGEMRLTGHTSGTLSMSFDEAALESVDTVIRIIGEQVKAEFQKQQLKLSQERQADGESSERRFDRAA